MLGNSNRGSISCELRTRPEDLPRDVPLLVIGVNNYDADAHLGHDVTIVEVLGFAPLMPGGGDADWDRATWLPFTPEAHDILQGRP